MILSDEALAALLAAPAFRILYRRHSRLPWRLVGTKPTREDASALIAAVGLEGDWRIIETRPGGPGADGAEGRRQHW